MTLNEYQDLAWGTAIFPDTKVMNGLNAPFVYPMIGLCGEVGEIAEKIKKFIRDGHIDHDALVKEMGDVLWYLSALASTFNVQLDDVATKNIEKLQSRRERGTLQGSGDNR